MNQSPRNLKLENQDLRNLALRPKNKFLLRIKVKLDLQIDKLGFLKKIERHIESNHIPKLLKMTVNQRIKIISLFELNLKLEEIKKRRLPILKRKSSNKTNLVKEYSGIMYKIMKSYSDWQSRKK